jgi:hypothetical protein
LRGQVAALRAGGGDHQLAAGVEAQAGAVVEGVDRGAGVEVEVGRPVGAFEHVPEEPGHVVNVQVRRVLLRGDEQVLRQRQLPLPEHGAGDS